MSPYVVTLAVDEETQARWDLERATWFPPGRTAVGAHVSLFHALPGDLDPEPDLERACDRPGFAVTVDPPRSLGRGVAYPLRSAGLDALHADLRRAWADRLTAQDAQGFRPHVTVQNKVDPETARRTLATLAAGFAAYDVAAVGVDLWRYLDGPWQHLRRFTLAGPPNLDG